MNDDIIRSASELLKKLEDRINTPMSKFQGLYLLDDEHGAVLTSQDECEALKYIGFRESVRYVFYQQVCYKQQAILDWNSDDEEVFSCPSYKKAIEWIKYNFKNGK